MRAVVKAAADDRPSRDGLDTTSPNILSQNILRDLQFGSPQTSLDPRSEGCIKRLILCLAGERLGKSKEHSAAGTALVLLSPKVARKGCTRKRHEPRMDQ